MIATNNLVSEDIKERTIFDWVPLSKVFVAEYGRPLSPQKVAAMAAVFDLQAIGNLYLSLRDEGSFACLDGQHRMEAARKNNVLELPARIYIDLSYEEEAKLYLQFATVNKQGANDRFRARLEAKEPKALTIVQTLWEAGGIALDLGIKKKGLTAVTTVEDIYTRFGQEGLREVASTLRSSWGTHTQAWSRATLTGTAMFLNRYRQHPEFRFTHLVERLRQTTPEIVLAQAGMVKATLNQGESSSAVGRVMLNLYNKRLREPLPEWAQMAYSPVARERVREQIIRSNKARGRANGRVAS